MEINVCRLETLALIKDAPRGVYLLRGTMEMRKDALLPKKSGRPNKSPIYRIRDILFPQLLKNLRFGTINSPKISEKSRLSRLRRLIKFNIDHLGLRFTRKNINNNILAIANFLISLSRSQSN